MSTVTTYRYTVRDPSGKTRTGTLEAGDQKMVATRLREMGFAPVSITAVQTGGLQREITIPGFGPKVDLESLAIFSRQFATMISSGVSLIRALNILAEQTDNKKLAGIVGELRADIEAGRSLSESMRGHEDFPSLYIAMVKAGETAGNLDEVLLRSAETMEKDLSL